MKKYFLIFIFSFINLISFAQNNNIESVQPTYNTEISRYCYAILNIDNKKIYYNCNIYLKSLSPDIFNGTYRVKVKIKDSENKILYKNIFKNDYLYIFSNGQIEIGRPRLDRIIIYNINGKWYGEINKNGIY